MKAIFSMILAILMALLSFIPGLNALLGKLPGTQPVGFTVGEWLDLLVTNFNMQATEYAEEPFFDAVPATDEYFVAVQICYEWGVVTAEDEFTTADALTKSFMGVTLVRCAYLKLDPEANMPFDLAGFANAEELATAVLNGFIALAGGKLVDGIASVEDALAALRRAVNGWLNKTFGEADLDVGLVEGDAAPGAQGLFDGEIGTEPTEQTAADVFETVAFQGDFEPDLRASTITDAAGNVLNNGAAGDPNSVAVQGFDSQFSLSDLKNFDIKDALSQIEWKQLLKKINLDFAVGPLNVHVNALENGFNVGLSGSPVSGLTLSKQYEMTNFDISSQLDANLLLGKINECYVRVGYDLKEVTAITGTAAESLYDTGYEGEHAQELMKKLEDALKKVLNASGGTVNLFSITVPIPQLPAITVTIKFSLTVTVDGRISLTVTSSELKGFEIINNQPRFLNQSNVKSRNYYVDANAELKANVDVDLSILGFCLVDLGVTAGLGCEAWVNVDIKNPDGSYLATQKFDLPFGILMETTLGANNDLIAYSGAVKIYGILEIYYGRRSVILGLIPAQYREFKLFGRSGAMFDSVIYETTFDNAVPVAA
ncbi:MAG: hypothetical protein FWH26_09675 [Oscillospiraceae bacterium]|nr:hypothetical protein [Oscillospiraceae bacterium]